MHADIEDFILYLATERGLSDNYQLSTRRSLETFAAWAQRKHLSEPRDVSLAHLQDFLAERKRAGLAASSIKLEIVALKIFFRWLTLRTRIAHDVADVLPLPRLVIKRDVKDIMDFRFEDFEVVGYQSHPHIAAPVAV